MLALIELALVATALGLGAGGGDAALTPPTPPPAPTPLPAPTPPPPTREEFWQRVHGEPSAPPSPRTTWYGGPAVVADVLAAVLGLGALKSESRSLFALGVLTYAVGPPINHFRHRRPGRGMASLGMRALGVLASVVAVYVVDDNNCFGDNPNAPDSCDLVMLVPLGVLATMIIDDAVLARF
jgi:hypothetical protein